MSSRSSYNRSSMYVSGGSSLGGNNRRTTMSRGAAPMATSRGGTGGTGLTGYMRDNRNLPDKNVQREYTEIISQRLSTLGYEPKSKRAFSGPIFNPSQAEFYSIVEYIFAKTWSPEFRLDNFSDKAEGVLCIAKLLRYPYALNKSIVSSLTPHNMPTIIGFVGWLADLGEEDKRIYGDSKECRVHPQADYDSGQAEINDMWQDYLTESFRSERDSEKIDDLDRRFEGKLLEIVERTEMEADKLENESSNMRREIEGTLNDLGDRETEIKECDQAIVRVNNEMDSCVSEIDELQTNISTFEAKFAEKSFEAEKWASTLSAAERKRDALLATIEDRQVAENDRRRLILERNQAMEEWKSAVKISEQRETEALGMKNEIQQLSKQVSQQVHEYRLSRAASLSTTVKSTSSSSSSGSEVDVSDKILSMFGKMREDVFLSQLNEAVFPSASRELNFLIEKNRRLADTISEGEEQLKGLEVLMASKRAAFDKLKRELDDYETTIAKEVGNVEKEDMRSDDRIRRLREELNEVKENVAANFRNENELNIRAVERERRERERIERERAEITDTITKAANALLDHRESIIRALGILESDSKQVVENCKLIEQQQQQQLQRRRSLQPSPAKRQQKGSLQPTPAKKQRLSLQPSPAKKQKIF